MKILCLLLLLGVVVHSEDVKHNLPEGLEIVDPKSLGLKTDDLDKILGNVKLLPIASGNVGDTKTQILTVGFDGDEKLNLDDFELPPNFNLPQKDQEIAQVAFKQFQEYIQNKGTNNENIERTTPSTISVTTQVAESQEPQHQQRNSEENRSRQQQQQQQQQQHHRQHQQNKVNGVRNSGENFQQNTNANSYMTINHQMGSREQFHQQVNRPNTNINFQVNHQQQQQQQQPTFPNSFPGQQVHQQRPNQMSHQMAFHSNPHQQINYQVVNHAGGGNENYEQLNYQNSPPQIKHRHQHQKPYQVFPPQHNRQSQEKISQQTKLVPAFESTEVFGTRIKNRNIETFSGNFNPPKEVSRNFIPNIVTTQRSVVDVTPSMPMQIISTNENAIRNFSRVNQYQNYQRDTFNDFNRPNNFNDNRPNNLNDNRPNNFNDNNFRHNNNFVKNYKPTQQPPPVPNQNQNRFVPPQHHAHQQPQLAQPSQQFQSVVFPNIAVPAQQHQPQQPRSVNFENVSQQSVAYPQVRPFTTFNQNPAGRQNVFVPNNAPESSKAAAPQPQGQQQQQAQSQQQASQQPFRNRRQSYGNKLISRFRRLFQF